MGSSSSPEMEICLPRSRRNSKGIPGRKCTGPNWARVIRETDRGKSFRLPFDSSPSLTAFLSLWDGFASDQAYSVAAEIGAGERLRELNRRVAAYVDRAFDRKHRRSDADFQ